MRPIDSVPLATNFELKGQFVSLKPGQSGGSWQHHRLRPQINRQIVGSYLM